MWLRRALVVGVALALAVASEASAAPRSVSYAKYKRVVTQRDRYKDRLFEAQVDLEDSRSLSAALNREIGALNANLTMIQRQLNDVTVQRDQAIVDRDRALRGLPDSILAAPLDRFLELVLNPARERWPCDSSYTSESYWSIDFHNQSFC